MLVSAAMKAGLDETERGVGPPARPRPEPTEEKMEREKHGSPPHGADGSSSSFEANPPPISLASTPISSTTASDMVDTETASRVPPHITGRGVAPLSTTAELDDTAESGGGAKVAKLSTEAMPGDKRKRDPSPPPGRMS